MHPFIKPSDFATPVWMAALKNTLNSAGKGLQLN